MKSTALNTKCFSRAPSKSRRGPRHAHTPVRRETDAARCAEAESGGYDDGGGTAACGDYQAARGVLPPRVLHVDADAAAATALAGLLAPEAQVIHAPTLTDARRLLASEVFSLMVIDPALPDGDVRSLLPLMNGMPLLVYSAHQPEWRGVRAEYLPKPWTTARQLWASVSAMLGISNGLSAGA